MNFKELANVIRKFDNIEYLAKEIETLQDDEDYVSDIQTVDELTEFLEDELEYANE